jgi:LmbE family N-acetylglucosaminyl deacetylase
MVSTNNILFVAPHPDDEVLGCGGLIKKLTLKGISVYVLVMTRGKKAKYSDEKIARVRNEALRAHKILGVTETRFLDFPAPDLDMVSLAEISETISGIIRELKIETLYLPHKGDIHHDHKVVFNAGMVAARPSGDNPVRCVFSYETLSETEWSAPFGDEFFVPTTFVDITDVFSYKLEAMKCFTSQLREFPNPRSLKAIEALSNFRGCTVGCSHAEAFETIRIIEK